MGLAGWEFRLKDFPGGKSGSSERALGSVGPAGEPDLMVANLKLFELDVLSFDVGRIAHEDHGIAFLSFPFGVNPMAACILDDPVEDVIGRNGQDACADLFEGQLDGVSAGHAGASDDGDDRLDAPLPQLEGEDDPVGLEEQTGLVHLGWEPVGEVHDQVFGEPGVDLLVSEDGLPVRFVTDIVAKLKALGDELLGAAARCSRERATMCTVIGGLVCQAEPGAQRDRGEHAQAKSYADQPLRRGLVHRTSRSVSEWDARAVNDQRSGASSQGANRGILWREVADPYMKDTTIRRYGQPGLAARERLDADFPLIAHFLTKSAHLPMRRINENAGCPCEHGRLTFYGHAIEFVRRGRYGHCSERVSTHSIH